MEYDQSYPIFGEKYDSFDFEYEFITGDDCIEVDKKTGEIKVIKADSAFEIRISVPETEYYEAFDGKILGKTKQTTQSVDFSNPDGYAFVTNANNLPYELYLNGEPHYGTFSVTWDGKGTTDNVIAGITLDKTVDGSEYLKVTFNPNEAEKAQGPLNIYATFDGDDNYEAKTIQTMITLGWDTSVPNKVVIECPNGKLVNGYYTAPVKVHPETSGIKFQAPDGSIVSEYWLKKDGAYGMRSPYFFKTNDDGHISTNVGQIGSIKIDQTAPASFSVDITNPDNSNPIRKFFTTFFTFFAAKEWDVTVTVKDATSGFDRIEYDCGDGVVRTVKTFTNTGSVVGSTDLITGKFKVPVGNKGKVKVWAYDLAGNCIGTHDKDGNLIPGYFRYEGDTVNTDVYVVVDNTKPKISVSFENNSAKDVEDESGNHVFYFKDERKATIQIQEDNYYAEDVQIIVKPHGSNVAFSKDELVSKFGLKYDDKQPKIYLTFADDGWYDFDVKYTDRSGNVADNPDFGNSVAPDSFVIDRTLPVVTINFDKNVAQNEFYYSLAKSAKIEVTEVNYDYKDLELDVSMKTNSGYSTIDKADLNVEQSKEGDKNIVDIIFAEDAEYDFKIKFKDLAGNEATIDYGKEESFHFVVDKTPPVINVEYSNNDVHNESFFNEGRTATITITEHNFDKKTTSVDVTTEYESENSDNKNPYVVHWTDSGDTHVAYLHFDDDNVYTFNVTCIDKAGNPDEGIVFENGTTAPYGFTVDTTEPSNLDIKVNGESVLGGNSITFDTFYKDAINITLEARCDISGEYALQYQMVDKASDYSFDDGKWIDYDKAGITISNTKKFILYFRAIDYASNVTCVNSTGIIVDNKEPEGEKHAPDIDILLSQANANGFYNGNVSAKLSIVDPAFIGDDRDPDGYYSGLKEIKYTIYTTDTDANEQGVLLDTSKGIGISDASIDNDKLAHRWTRTIVIDADKFNSNNVIVQVEAVDNAGNIRITRTNLGDIKIDATKPRINVSYNNNNVELN
ncbi:MAG: hypothetical protein IKH50_05220, partial [Oscillospiraceae bacterium]|nr:hypothetical protein [Oscillospiraceae bacterium]